MPHKNIPRLPHGSGSGLYELPENSPLRDFSKLRFSKHYLSGHEVNPESHKGKGKVEENRGGKVVDRGPVTGMQLHQVNQELSREAMASPLINPEHKKSEFSLSLKGLRKISSDSVEKDYRRGGVVDEKGKGGERTALVRDVTLRKLTKVKETQEAKEKELKERIQQLQKELKEVEKAKKELDEELPDSDEIIEVDENEVELDKDADKSRVDKIKEKIPSFDTVGGWLDWMSSATGALFLMHIIVEKIFVQPFAIMSSLKNTIKEWREVVRFKKSLNKIPEFTNAIIDLENNPSAGLNESEKINALWDAINPLKKGGKQSKEVYKDIKKIEDLKVYAAIVQLKKTSIYYLKIFKALDTTIRLNGIAMMFMFVTVPGAIAAAAVAFTGMVALTPHILIGMGIAFVGVLAGSAIYKYYTNSRAKIKKDLLNDFDSKLGKLNLKKRLRILDKLEMPRDKNKILEIIEKFKNNSKNKELVEELNKYFKLSPPLDLSYINNLEDLKKVTERLENIRQFVEYKLIKIDPSKAVRFIAAKIVSDQINNAEVTTEDKAKEFLKKYEFFNEEEIKKLLYTKEERGYLENENQFVSQKKIEDLLKDKLEEKQ